MSSGYAKSLAQAKAEEVDYFVHDPRTLPSWKIPDKVVIGVAPSGRSLYATHRPGYPQTPEEFSRAAMDAVDAGACWVHWDFNFVTAENELRAEPLSAYERSIRAVRDVLGRSFVSDANILFGDTFQDNLAPIMSGVAETTPIGMMHPAEWIVEAVQAIQGCGAAVQVTVHDPGEIVRAHDVLIRTGLLKKPHFWLILIGLPREVGRLPRPSTYLPNPAAMVDTLQLMVRLINEVSPDSIVAVCAAGRASHYIATLAMLLGLHVRVGLEDSCWRFPHRDEEVASNRETVERAVRTAEVLGRTVASADDFRAMLDLKR